MEPLKMKTWTFTFATCEAGNGPNGDWGWNSVMAKTKKTAVKKATKWCADVGEGEWILDVGSVSCNEHTEKALLSNFY